MMTDELKKYAKRLNLTELQARAEVFVHNAQLEKPTYLDFLTGILREEVECREKRDFERRMRKAKLPRRHDLDDFDFNFCSGITRPELAELRQMLWVKESYNIILMGPSGTGKTFIASGLVYQAVLNGMKAYMLSMEEIITTLKLKELSVKAMAKYNEILRADLIAIDDIMLFPVKKEVATSFFNLINALYEKTSIIITTNKSPTEWAETLDDEVLASALLDRLLYRCQVIKLSGNSYRMENRKDIFKSNNKPKSSDKKILEDKKLTST